MRALGCSRWGTEHTPRLAYLISLWPKIPFSLFDLAASDSLSRGIVVSADLSRLGWCHTAKHNGRLARYHTGVHLGCRLVVKEA
jgi:hypothetical protein